MQSSIEVDVETFNALIVDSTGGSAGEIVSQVKHVIRRLAVIEKVSKGPLDDSDTAHLTGIHIVCDIDVMRPSLDMTYAAHLSASRQD